MAAITAIHSATPGQAVLLKTRLERARREANQAEASAQSLRAQADTAEVDARKSQDNVRNLSARSREAPLTYDSRINSKSEVPTKTQDFLVSLYRATSEKFSAGGNALKTNPSADPVINSQGQSTGRIVNVSA